MKLRTRRTRRIHKEHKGNTPQQCAYETLKHFIVLVFLATSLSLSGQTLFSKVYKPGDKLYVFTPSGLTLRDKPDAHGTALKVLPYGTEVIVEPNPDPVSFTNSGIQGVWAKVKVGQQSGYVFDGFLSRMAAVQINSDPSASEWADYLKHRYQVTDQTAEPPDSTIQYYLHVTYQNRLDIEYIAAPGGSDVNTTFPKSIFTFKEIYLLAKVVYPDFFKEGACAYAEGTLECQVDDGNKLSIRDNDTGWTLGRRHLD